MAIEVASGSAGNPSSAGLESDEAIDQLTVWHQNTVLPALESLLPASILSKGQSSRKQISAAYVTFLAYSATNNFAGIEGTPLLPMMYDFLRPIMTDLLLQDSLNTSCALRVPEIASAKPMAETYFRCAIDRGDVDAIRRLVLSRDFSIDVNDCVCIVDGVRFTPVARSAHLQHTDLTKALLLLGADIYKSFDEPQFHWPYEYYPAWSIWDHVECPRRSRFPRNALDWAIYDTAGKCTVNYDLITALVNAKGTVSLGSWFDLLEDAQHEPRIVRILARTQIHEKHTTWANCGAFHRAFHLLDLETISTLLRAMIEEQVELDAGPQQLSRCRESLFDNHHYSNMPRRLLDIASFRGHVTVVQTLLRNGATPTNDTLPAAVRSQNRDLIELLLTKGLDLDAFSFHYRTTPYAEAIRYKDGSLVRVLSEAGVSYKNVESFRFCAVLAAAAEAGRASIVDEMLQIPTRAKQNTLGYALVHAVQQNHSAVALRLLEAGAATWERQYSQVFDLPSENPAQCPSLLLDALRNRNLPLARALWEHDAALHSPGEPALSYAVECSDISLVRDIINAGGLDTNDTGPLSVAVRNEALCYARLLLKSGVQLTTSSNRWQDEHAPLVEAIRLKDMEMLHLLLEYGADPSTPPALREALSRSELAFEKLFRKCLGTPPGALSGRQELVDLLIRNDRLDYLRHLPLAQLLTNAVDGANYGEAEFSRPLATAIRKDDKVNVEIVQILLDAGVEVDNIIERRGWRTSAGSMPPSETALLVAIGTGRSNMVEAILSYGACINPSLSKGIKRTPLQKAAEMGSRQLVQLLLDRGADPDGPSAVRGGATAIQLAAMGGYIGIVELLRQHGADITAPGCKVYGRTAIEGAAEHGRYDMVSYLLLEAVWEMPLLEKAKRYASENGHAAIVEAIEDAQAVSIATSHRRPKAFCKECKLQLSNVSALRRHEATAHGDPSTRGRYVCAVCTQTFSRRDLMQRHELSHRGLGQVVCEVCKRRFRKDYLQQHVRSCRRRQQRRLD